MKLKSLSHARLICLCAILLLCTTAWATPQPVAASVVPIDGSWSGTNNQGWPVSFDVTTGGTQWDNFVLKVTVSGGCTVTMTHYLGGPGAITDGQFSIGGNPSVSGTFSSPSTASGTYTYINYWTPCGTIYYYSGTWTASIPTPAPGDFSKSSPADGATDQSINPTLSWGSSSFADTYEYCIDEIDNDDCDTSWISTGTNTSVSLFSLKSNTLYYWHVRASNTTDTTYANGSATAFWSFTTQASPFFGDVPETYWAFSFIETLYYNGITSGCGGGDYCPNRSVTRAEMAIFLLRGIHGADYTPPAATGIFDDVPIVPTKYWAADWIEQLYEEGITSGCSKSPMLYCPNRSVTRAEMAIFLLRAKHTSSYTPDPATGIFDDAPIVPTKYWAADWVEQLYKEGITSGCSKSPMLYCPNRSITRAEMAIFLTKTFNLTMP